MAFINPLITPQPTMTRNAFIHKRHGSKDKPHSNKQKMEICKDLDNVIKYAISDFATYLNSYKGQEEIRFDFMVIDYMQNFGSGGC